jgi:hypothetical protein
MMVPMDTLAALAHLWPFLTGLAAVVMATAFVECEPPRGLTRLGMLLLVAVWLGLVWSTAVGLVRVVL